MRSNKFFAFSMAALVALTCNSSALAQGGESSGGKVDPRMDGPLALYKMSGINAEQEELIRKLAKEFEDAQRVRAKTLIALLQTIKGLSLQPDPPEEQLLSTQAEVNKITGDMAIERTKLLLRVRKVLTPDQRKKLVSLMTDDQPQAQAPAQPAQGKDGAE